MCKISKKLLLVFVVATLAGSCLHFVFSIFPNPVTALFSPTNESLWEHVKILFWPYVVAALVITHGGEKGCKAPWMLSLLVICGGMLILGFAYHLILRGQSLVVDVGIYVLMMAAGFLLPGVFHRVADKPVMRGILIFAVLALCIAVLIFTFFPPNNIFFADLSGVNTWTAMPNC